MKKIYLLWIPVLCLLWRCNENDHMTWKSKGGVYFEDYSQEADSLQYSFRITGLERDTLQLTVKLQGALLDRPMNFRVVTEEGSTAQAGVLRGFERQLYFPGTSAGDSVTGCYPEERRRIGS